MGAIYIPLFFLLILNLFKNNIYRYLVIFSYNFLYFGLILGISIYYKYFLIIPYYSAIFQMGNLPQITNQIFAQLIGFQELFFIFLFIISVIFSIIVSKHKFLNSLKIVTALIFVLIIFITQTVFIAYRAHNGFKNIIYYVNCDSTNAFAMYGFWPFYTSQIIVDLRKPVVTKKNPVSYYKHKLNISNYQSKKFDFKNYNIIMIQVESLDSKVIDYKVNNQFIMPFLHAFKSKSVYFNNIYPINGGGYSSDSELSIFTSLIPLNSHSGIMSADYKRIKPLNKELAKYNYYSAVMHGYAGTFFNRTWFFKFLGINDFFEQASYSGLAKGWYSKDIEFFKQSIPKIKKFQFPFFAYLITMQSHGPFENHDTANNLDLKNINNSLLKNYFMSINEVDKALAIFINGLKKEGLLDKSIVIIFGDHDSHIEDTIYNPKSVLKNTIPLIIYQAKLLPSVNNKIGSQIDFGPTVLNLLSIPEPKNAWLGTSLFYAGKGKALFQNLSVIENINGKITLKKETNLKPLLDYSFSIFDFSTIPGS
jgi:phosphoglycerol transferase MdoB-like AlkP superfamily enzyme